MGWAWSRACTALFFACTVITSLLVAAPASAQATIQYLGGQGFDPRDLRTLDMAMAFSGSEVAGSFRLSSACQGAVAENGGEGTFQAVLIGVWESQTAVIQG